MRIAIQSKPLRNVISRINPGSGKPNSPILATILISASENGSCSFTFTEDDCVTSCTASAQVAESGALALSAKKIDSIIKELPDGQTVYFRSTTKHGGCISWGESSFNIFGMDPSEYPAVSHRGASLAASLDWGEFKGAVTSAFSAAAKDDVSRAFLTGVHVEIDRTTAFIVATDGRRLGYGSIAASSSGQASVIIPSRTCEKIARAPHLPKGEIMLDGSSFSADIPGFFIFSRVVRGVFPNWRRVVPVGFDGVFQVRMSDIQSATKKASAFAGPNSAIHFASSPEGVDVAVWDNAAGDYKDRVDLLNFTSNFDFAINCDFLLKALQHIKGDIATFRYNSSGGGIQLEGSSPVKFLIMPIA